MNAQKSLTLSNKNGNTITINGDLRFTLDGVFYASKSAQNRKSKTGELTNSCYVSMPQGTISFSGEGVKEFFENADTTKTTTRTRTKNADSVRVLTTYATFEEYLDKNADAQKLTRIRNTASVSDYTSDIVKKIEDLQIVLASMQSEYSQVHALTDEEFKSVLARKYAKNEDDYKTATLAKTNKNDLVELAKAQADELAKLREFYEKMQAMGLAE